MTWCVTIEIPGEPPRIVGSFSSVRRAETIQHLIKMELRRRDVSGADPVLREIVPAASWNSIIPWDVS